MLVCSILNEKLENLLSFFGGGEGIVTSLAYIYTMELKDSCQRVMHGELLLCTIFVIVQFCFLFQDMISAVYRGL